MLLQPVPEQLYSPPYSAGAILAPVKGCAAMTPLSNYSWWLSRDRAAGGYHLVQCATCKTAPMLPIYVMSRDFMKETDWWNINSWLRRVPHPYPVGTAAMTGGYRSHIRRVPQPYPAGTAAISGGYRCHIRRVPQPYPAGTASISGEYRMPYQASTAAISGGDRSHSMN
jgi:hypothetical protein